jgi:uncharacterized protein (DUF1697 family)
MVPVSRFLALLRGINVGGRNQVRMADLKACFSGGGFTEVATYIQTGNVVFEANGGADAASLTARLERLLAASFGFEIAVVVIEGHRLREIVDAAPPGFGTEPGTYRYDVLFLKPPLTDQAALPMVPVRAGVDDVHAGPGALYSSRLIARASQSRLSRIAGLPIYRNLTIRNWNTTTRLLEMIER